MRSINIPLSFGLGLFFFLTLILAGCGGSGGSGGVKSKICCKFSPVIDVFSLPGQRYCYPV